MTATGLSQFDETIHLTNIWLKEIMEETGCEDRHKAYRALRATLQTLRDRLTPDGAAHLSAQLPMLVRGMFFEGWHPARTPNSIRSINEFLAPIEAAFDRDDDLDGRTAAGATFRVMQRHISEGEIRHVIEALPRPVRELFS